jgi:hypothetical protein
VDFAYIGTRFIATQEANAVAGYKEMIVESAAADIVYTPFFSGVHGNYLKKSVAAAGLDPDRLPVADKASMSFASDRPAKVWKDIWGAGQGVGNIDEVLPARELVARLQREYAAARAALAVKGAIGVEAAWSPPPAPPIHTGAVMPLIDLLPSDATLTQILPGHVVFAQGDPGSIMYVLIEGEAQVLLDGKVVETVRQGGILGEMALIDSGPRSATAIAKTRCGSHDGGV